MLKKMRWRVIGAAMLAFFLVILLVAGLVNIVNYCVVTDRADETIDYILEFETMRHQNTGYGNGGMMPRPDNGEPFMGLPDEEENYMTRFFIVIVDSEDMVIATSMDYVATIDEAEAVSYTNEALSRHADRGYVHGYRYARYENNDTTLVVFLNAAREVQYMNSLLLMTLAISGGSLLLVFILVVLLSHRAIRPIAQNIELQKRFITDASHELKTPLTSMSTSLEVIEMEHGSDEWTDNIRSQIGRMSGLVSNLVTLSRLDEVKPVPDRESFDLSSTAMEVLGIYTAQAAAAGKSIVTDIEENVSFTGSRSSVRQMLSVLIDNAIRYSDDNSEIRFTLNRSHGKVHIEIFNTCSYDKAPDTDRLFDRFYRPDESRSTATGGNGIGLAIARSVVKAHGGRISARCPSGKSMTITVEM
ncbi:Signal transduction histidine kinase [Ruminococcaceae bacterium YRB3002]|nr:Signal transduction histidine kinase [Ruminococcaceae bacterium YRB3002]